MRAWTGFNGPRAVPSVGYCEHQSIRGVKFFDQPSNYNLFQEGMSSVKIIT